MEIEALHKIVKKGAKDFGLSFVSSERVGFYTQYAFKKNTGDAVKFGISDQEATQNTKTGLARLVETRIGAAMFFHGRKHR